MHVLMNLIVVIISQCVQIVHQAIMLYTLNTYSFCQLYISKAGVMKISSWVIYVHWHKKNEYKQYDSVFLFTLNYTSYSSFMQAN